MFNHHTLLECYFSFPPQSFTFISPFSFHRLSLERRSIVTLRRLSCTGNVQVGRWMSCAPLSIPESRSIWRSSSGSILKIHREIPSPKNGRYKWIIRRWNCAEHLTRVKARSVGRVHATAFQRPRNEQTKWRSHFTHSVRLSKDRLIFYLSDAEQKCWPRPFACSCRRGNCALSGYLRGNLVLCRLTIVV